MVNLYCKGVHPGGMHPIFLLGEDDNTFITPNIGRNCYAIAIKYSMSGEVGGGGSNQRAIAVSAPVRLS